MVSLELLKSELGVRPDRAVLLRTEGDWTQWNLFVVNDLTLTRYKIKKENFHELI